MRSREEIKILFWTEHRCKLCNLVHEDNEWEEGGRFTKKDPLFFNCLKCGEVSFWRREDRVIVATVLATGKTFYAELPE